MYARAIREEREGPSDTAMQVEVIPTWELDSHDVIVLVMAAGINYNGIWASLGTTVSTAFQAADGLRCKISKLSAVAKMTQPR